MKITMVSEHASPLATIGGVDSGGQNVHVAALSEALAQRGHEVSVYTRRDDVDLPDRVELAPGVVVEHVPAGPPAEVPKDELLPYMAEFGRYLANRFDLDPPDLVHAHFWMSGLAAMLATRGTEIPVIQTFHALGVVKRRYQGGRDTSPPQRLRFERAIGHDAASVIATCSDEVAELIRLGVSRRRISVVPCGVDVDHFTPDGPRLPPGRERYRIVCVGRLVERKGFADVVRALPLVPHAELLLAGGPDRDSLSADPEAQRLQSLARELGVEERVRLIGRVSRQDMPALLRSADLLVSVPWYEPFGIVPLEAMACGVPVLASAVGGLVDTVVEGSTGMLVPPRRPDVLAHALRRLLGDPVRRQAYGIAGVDRAQARYSWDRVAADSEHVYRDVLDAVSFAPSVGVAG
jgi:D-inositol-3-phosphate glycosyltransferase